MQHLNHHWCSLISFIWPQFGQQIIPFPWRDPRGWQASRSILGAGGHLNGFPGGLFLPWLTVLGSFNPAMDPKVHHSFGTNQTFPCYSVRERDLGQHSGPPSHIFKFIAACNPHTTSPDHPSSQTCLAWPPSFCTHGPGQVHCTTPWSSPWLSLSTRKSCPTCMTICFLVSHASKPSSLHSRLTYILC